MIKEAYYSENVDNVDNIPVKGRSSSIQIKNELEQTFFAL